MARATKAHFIAAAGAGVSALAQFHVMGGGPATGSDRSFDRGLARDLRRKLETAGVLIYPQDGSALDGSHAYAVASAAVEEDNPDLARARALGLEVLHRADMLARHVAGHRAIAVAGTSGKSTVTAMVFEILETAGRSPSVITGGPLQALERRGLVGNAWRGRSDLLVVEADESDGTVTRYRPWLGVLLNLSKDHMDPAKVRGLFAEFAAQSRELVVNADSPGLEGLERRGLSFGLERGELRARDLSLAPEGSRFTLRGVEFRLPVPGRHNVENAVAAAAACLKAGIPLEASAAALASFQGVARRLQLVGRSRGVAVIDDFAHNPVKLAAAIAAVKLGSRRVHAVFQLHGYAPARFMKAEYAQSLAESLGPEDTLWMPEIYYAGGTASRDVSAKDIVDAVAARGRAARFFEKREDLVPDLARRAQAGDSVLVMGARDPSLSDFARQVLAALGKG